MSLKLIPPGQRKGNKFYLVRGHIKGKRYEYSTDTTDRAAAEKFKREFEKGLQRLASDERANAPMPTPRAPKSKAAATFSDAARDYINFKDPSKNDRYRIARIGAAGILDGVIFGTMPIADIRHHHLVAVANALHGEDAAATKNRHVIRPAAAILHYAAKQELIPWRRFAPFEEPRPVTRAVSREFACDLINAAPPGVRRLMLLWLLRQGTRISDTLRVQWSDPDNAAGAGIDLGRQIVRMHIGKTDQWTEFPLDPEVFEHLAAIPASDRQGRLFPWRYRQGVYKWLRPLAASLGHEFTPHMARHSVGSWANEDGEGLRTIMAILGHADVKSSIRYQAGDVSIVRAAFEKRRRIAS
jgi:integrase